MSKRKLSEQVLKDVKKICMQELEKKFKDSIKKQIKEPHVLSSVEIQMKKYERMVILIKSFEGFSTAFFISPKYAVSCKHLFKNSVHVGNMKDYKNHWIIGNAFINNKMIDLLFKVKEIDEEYDVVVLEYLFPQNKKFKPFYLKLDDAHYDKNCSYVAYQPALCHVAEDGPLRVGIHPNLYIVWQDPKCPLFRYHGMMPNMCGDSGTPIITEDGKVIGMNTMVQSIRSGVDEYSSRVNIALHSTYFKKYAGRT